MFSHRVFTTDFRIALEEELERKDMTIKELADRAGIPAATLYKITSGERDPRFSTVKAIADALDPRERDFVAVIGVKFLLDELQGTSETAGGKTFRVRGYTANTMEECIIAAVRAEKDGAAGIICAPILSTLVERIVDIPVTIIKPNPEAYVGAFESIVRMIE